MRVAAVAACLLAAGASASEPRFDARLQVSRENLDRGYADWREETFELALRESPDRLGYLRLRRTDRYGLEDREAALGAVLSPAPAWTVQIEGTRSADARVLPAHAVSATVGRVLGDGWGLAGTLRRTAFASSDVTMGNVLLERYAGPYRVAYTGYLSRPDSSAWGSTHRVAAAWFGSGLTRIEAGVARGRESENSPAGLLTSRVRAANLSASLGLAPGFALTLDLERVRQGDLYTRQTVRLGSRVLF